MLENKSKEKKCVIVQKLISNRFAKGWRGFLFCVILIIFGIIVRGIDICLITNFCWKTSSILFHFRTILKKLQIYADSFLRMRKNVSSKF